MSTGTAGPPPGRVPAVRGLAQLRIVGALCVDARLRIMGLRFHHAPGGASGREKYTPARRPRAGDAVPREAGRRRGSRPPPGPAARARGRATGEGLAGQDLLRGGDHLLEVEDAAPGQVPLLPQVVEGGAELGRGLGTFSTRVPARGVGPGRGGPCGSWDWGSDDLGGHPHPVRSGRVSSLRFVTGAFTTTGALDGTAGRAPPAAPGGGGAGGRGRVRGSRRDGGVAGTRRDRGRARRAAREGAS